jgi:hypothetical protein
LKQEGFLSAPHTYYEAIPERLAHMGMMKEDINEIEN